MIAKGSEATPDSADSATTRRWDGIPAPGGRSRHTPVHRTFIPVVPAAEAPNPRSSPAKLSHLTVQAHFTLVVRRHIRTCIYLYVRKYNPTIFYNSVTSVFTRFALHHNFNDFAIYTVNYRILALLLEGAVPESAHSTVDSTYYTHSPSLSTVEANSGLGSLDRGDTNKTSRTSTPSSPTRQATRPSTSPPADIPMTNITGTIPGPLNMQYYVPITAPNTSAVGAWAAEPSSSRCGVEAHVDLTASNVDTSFTAASAPAINVTAQGKTVSWLGPRVAAASANSSSGSGDGAAATGARQGMVGAMVLGALLAGVAALLLA
ncbi:hypothetical protein EDB83DRAFT_2520210 [Lactarius deliciosus]|nr:hypothetical protein EDB83DRAFT_2520210 [Lactarius deliciosus]